MPVISPSSAGDAPSGGQAMTTDDGQAMDLHLTPDPGPDGPGRRWMPVAIVGVTVLAVGAAAAFFLLRSSGDDEGAVETAPIRAVEAEQRDLIEYTNLDGTLGYALAGTVTTASDGAITRIIADGDAVERGDVAYEIDARPVVVFYGDIPFYRPLREGAEGEDVEILEANLASLGYHAEDDDGTEVDTGFTVDGVFDASTTDAVIRWQADLDVEQTGEVSPGDVVITPGPSIASNLRVEVGSVAQLGAGIMDLNVTAVVSSFYSEHAGELELQVTSGEIASGQILYVVDDLPYTAVVTDEDFDRDLAEGIDDGDDVLLLEEMLVSLGYDARGDLDVDDEFDELTTEAIEDWEEDLQDRWEDVVIDGVLSLDEIVVVDPGTTVGMVTGRDGDVTATGSELFTAESRAGNRIVTTAIDVSDQDKLVEGTAVDVEFPDGAIVTGTVTKVATSSIKDPTDEDAAAQLPVEITLGAVPESVAGLNELDVEVKVVESLAAAATVIPAAALVSTADGGFAVEVVSGNTTNFVAVEPGMFADGFVEVSGIDPEVAVVVPS